MVFEVKAQVSHAIKRGLILYGQHGRHNPRASLYLCRSSQAYTSISPVIYITFSVAEPPNEEIHHPLDPYQKAFHPFFNLL